MRLGYGGHLILEGAVPDLRTQVTVIEEGVRHPGAVAPVERPEVGGSAARGVVNGVQLAPVESSPLEQGFRPPLSAVLLLTRKASDGSKGYQAQTDSRGNPTPPGIAGLIGDHTKSQSTAGNTPSDGSRPTPLRSGRADNRGCPPASSNG